MIKHDLIEQVRGIEKAREIVEGAPKYATHKNDVFGYVKFKWSVGGCVVFDEWCPDDAPVTQIYKTNWHENSTDIKIFNESSIDLNDLRTAIAEHDSREFKVGDLIVLLHKIYRNDVFELTRLLQQTYDEKDIAYRHATPEEIKAGHRIDKQLESDDVTDIKNHLSPSTLVWDLASGDDWTVEAERHG